MSSFKEIKDLLNINRVASANTSVDWRPVVLSGINTDVDTGTVPEDLTSSNNGQVYLPSTAATLSVVSTSANDTLAGTGAQTILIEGLDSNWNELVESVNLNGLTPVTTTNSFFRINFVRVVSAGTGKKNAGTITLTHGATVMRTITIGESMAHALVFSVPLGHEFFIIHSRFQFNRQGAAGLAEIVNKTFVSTSNTEYLGTRITVTDQSPNQSIDLNGIAVARVPEKCDTWYTVTYVSANNCNISGSVRGILAKMRIL